jgi:rod shape-determining protein MreD
MAFMANTLSRRILWFGLAAQALHVLGILLVGQILMFGVRMIAGASFPGFAYFAGPFIGAALWPILSFLMLAPQRRPENVDETRPI